MMRSNRRAWRFMLAGGVVMLGGLAAGAQDATPVAPKPAAAAPAATKAPVYDEQADAKADIAAALAKARLENRRVLIQWGGNWCGWCVKLNAAMKGDRELAKTLMYEYDVVKIDIGHMDKNMDLAEKYGADLKKNGVPFLTVLDASGKVLANAETGGFELSKDEAAKPTAKFAHDTGKLVKFLSDHRADYLDARAVYEKGLAEAKASGRKVFLHFGAPWCPWCHTLENWMARPEVASVLSKDFVDVKIDEDRMIGGKEFEAKIRGEKSSGGIPWFCFIDGEGKTLSTSDAKGNNIGYPGEPEEIAHFGAMLQRAGVADAARQTLVKSLEANKPAH